MLSRETGKTDPFDAMVDTGAHMTLIPFYIWKEARIERLGSYEVSGISPKPECKVPVVVGKVELTLHDKYGAKSDPLKVPACLALSDEVPFIIGFMDFLSKFKVFFDYGKKEAYVETKEK